MTESNNNQNVQHKEEQKPSDETQPEYRDISDEKLKQILEDHKKWLESDGKEGERADLSHLDLRNHNFRYADLRKVDFTYTNLQNSDFKNVNLRNSNLKNANLKNTNLSGGNFDNAILSGADLSDSFLFETQFFNTKLTNTEFNNSEIGYCSFRNVDLSVAKGLNETRHFYMSSIDVDTLYLSKKPIPDDFYRGAGLDENFINYIPSFVNQPIQFYSCFISYSHEDKSFAQRIHVQLQGKGIRCWLDEHQMLPGDDIYEQVDRGIRLYDKVLLCCSESSLTSWWVDNELSTAFKKEQRLMKDRGKKVLSLIPLNLDGYMFSDQWESGKKTQVLERLATDFIGWEKDNDKFEKQFERVVKALRTGESGREIPLEPKL